MSEKGQGDEETQTNSGASAADQTGPHKGDTRTRERGPWSQPDPNAPDVDLGKPELPPPPEDPSGGQEPSFPGSGPTDTRSGWDSPSGEGPRGDPPEWQGPPQEPEAARPGHETADPQPENGEDDDHEELTIDPPSLEPDPSTVRPTDRPPNLTDEQFEKWKADPEHPERRSALDYEEGVRKDVVT